MKKTWKQLLATVSAGRALRGPFAAPRALWGTLTLGALMAAPVWGQLEDDGIVVLGNGAQPAATEPQVQTPEGGVQLGTPPELQPPSTLQAGPQIAAVPPWETPYPQAPVVIDDPTIYPSGVPRPGAGASVYAPAGGALGYAVTQNPEDILFRVGRRNNDIYGVAEGFTSIGAYASHQEDANTVWFFNPRLLLTDQGRGGVNLGFGQKAYYPEIDRVFSLSAWWDYDAGHQSDYNQVGISLELIGQNSSIRSNANFVVSRDEHRYGATNVGAAQLLSDGSIVQPQVVFNEVAYNQADVEFATPMPLAGAYGWEWAAGAYFLFGGDGRDATGVSGRIESQVTEDLWVNALITSDRVFDTNVSINLEFTVPHAPPSKWVRRPSVRDHLWTSVRRYYRVATAIVRDMQTVPVMGPDGQQMRLALIDPNIFDDPVLALGGSGTIDDPFRSIADYMDETLETLQQFGIIAVRSRLDDTDTNLNTTITLLNGQALFGEGLEHSLDGLGLNPIALPIASSGIELPRLSNSEAPGQNVVTLASRNQVAGFNIDAGGTASGIVGDGIRGFNVNRVNMTNVIDGIRIRSLGASGGSLGIIRDNTITGVGLGSTRGISIEHEAGTLGLLVRNNTVSNFQGEDANSNGILDASEDLNMNGMLDPGEDIDFDGRLDLSEDLNANGVLDRGFGIRIAASGGSTILANDPDDLMLPLGILSNTLTTNGTGLSLVSSGGAVITADVQDNIATGSTDLGEDADGDGLLDLGEDLNMNGVLDFGSGINLFASGGTISLVTFTGNTGSDGAGNGATIQTFNGGAINFVNPNVDPDTLDPALAFSNNTFNNNALDGMFVLADSGSITFDQIQNSMFSGNGDDGIDLQTDNGGTIFIRDPLLGNVISNNGDNGIEATGGIGGGISLVIGDPLAGNPNTITGNGNISGEGSGIFLGTIGGTLNTTFAGLTSTNNAGSGATIFLDGGTIVLNGIQNNSFTGNALHGLVIDNNNGGTLITPFVADNDFSNNGLAGLFLTGEGPGNGMGTTALTDLGSVTRNNFNRDVSGTEGILIDASDQRIRATLTQNSFVGRRRQLDINGNVIEAGAGRGIGGQIDGSTTSPAPGGLTLAIGTGVPADSNTFLNNGDAHIGLILGGNTTNNITVDNGQFNNAFDQPGTPLFMGEGIHYILRDTAVLTGYVRNSEFLNNFGDGLLIEIAGNNDTGNTPFSQAARLQNFSIVRNTFDGNGSLIDQDGDGTPDLALSSGIKISRTERGQFNDLLIDRNVSTNNTENGITISSIGANQLNLPNMRADTVMIVNNEITNNLQDGIEFIVGADADMAARLDSNMIVMNGFGEVPGNVNVGNGIEVRELVQDAKDSRSLTGLWTRNTITDNFDDGIDISAIVGNSLTDLTEAGVYTVAPPPAGTTVPVLGELRTFGLVIGDTMLNPVGVIDDMFNLIQRNGGDGLDYTGGGSLTLANNFITENGTPDTFGAFTVARHAGVNIDGSELNAGISGRQTGRDSRPLPNDDFDPERDAYRDMFIYSNLISLNNGDGIEFLSEPSFDAADSASSGGAGGLAIETRLTIAQNEITLNQFRGIDILQRAGDADPLDRDNEDPDGVATLIDSSFVSADVSIIGNHVKGNREEGIYIVQTVDNVQNQVSPSNDTINAAGGSISNGESLRAQGTNADIDDIVRIRLDIHDNEIIGNGIGIIDLPASGLVVRVGTSGGTPNVGGYPAPIFDPNIGLINAANYFATTGFNSEDLDGDGLLDNDLDGDGFLDAQQVTGSGISASVTGNLFDGNFGDDILFHSFTATEQPTTTNGTWNDMEFTVMVFQADPLARLDLIFSNNRFNSVEANNIEATLGTSPGNAGTADAGAYYDNAEPVFKSREGMADPGGPFANNGGIRQRNATRFASRYVTGPFPLAPLVSPENGLFKYPGMGNSTFRVRGTGNGYTDQGLGVVTLPQIFIFDDPDLVGDPDLIDAVFEANGVFPSVNPATFGELPWGWDVLEPGTPPLPFSF